MLDFSYQSTQTFQYQNKANIDRINMIEGLTNVKFIEQEKIVQYTLDRKKYIRLSDLMFWIETGFARFHLGQLLQLFKKLIEKVKYLKEQNIEHEYLTLDRIWLQLDNQSSTLSIIYKNLLEDQQEKNNKNNIQLRGNVVNQIICQKNINSGRLLQYYQSFSHLSQIRERSSTDEKLLNLLDKNFLKCFDDIQDSHQRNSNICPRDLPLFAHKIDFSMLDLNLERPK